LIYQAWGIGGETIADISWRGWQLFAECVDGTYYRLDESAKLPTSRDESLQSCAEQGSATMTDAAIDFEAFNRSPSSDKRIDFDRQERWQRFPTAQLHELAKLYPPDYHVDVNFCLVAAIAGG
jgi:hypothetical protein